MFLSQAKEIFHTFSDHLESHGIKKNTFHWTTGNFMYRVSFHNAPPSLSPYILSQCKVINGF